MQNDLQKRFNLLKEELNSAEIAKARAETSLEIEELNKAKLEKEILDLTGVETIEEAILKQETLQEELDKLLEEAKSLLG